MTSNKLIQSVKFKHWRPMIGVTVGAGDDGVAVTVSATTLRFDRRSDLVIVAGGFIVLFADLVIAGLVGGIIGVDVDILNELYIVVVFVAAIALEVFVTVSCVGDVRAGVWTGTAIDSDATFVMRVGAMVGVLIDLLAVKIIGFVTRIGVDVLAGVDANMVAAAMTDLEFFDTRVSLEDALRCC